MQEEFVLAGFGGQGVMFAGQLLAYAAMDEGLEATWIPSYGPEMRGGTANCTVVFSDELIGSPVVKHPKVVIALNNPSFEKYEPQVAQGGLLAYNSSLVELKPHRTDIDILAVPASELAKEVGNMRLMNMIILSAVLARYPAMSLDALRRAIESHIPAHRRNLLPQNYEAIAKGEEFVKKLAIKA